VCGSLASGGFRPEEPSPGVTIQVPEKAPAGIKTKFETAL